MRPSFNRNSILAGTRATSSRTSGAPCMAAVSTGTKTGSAVDAATNPFSSAHAASRKTADSEHRADGQLMPPPAHPIDMTMSSVFSSPQRFLTKNLDTNLIPRSLRQWHGGTADCRRGLHRDGPSQAMRWRHSAGPVLCMQFPSTSTAIVTGMSWISNSKIASMPKSSNARTRADLMDLEIR